MLFEIFFLFVSRFLNFNRQRTIHNARWNRSLIPNLFFNTGYCKLQHWTLI